MQSKLPLLPSGPGGVRKSTVHGPWREQLAAAFRGHQGQTLYSVFEPAQLPFFGEIKQTQNAHPDGEQVNAYEHS